MKYRALAPYVIMHCGYACNRTAWKERKKQLIHGTNSDDTHTHTNTRHSEKIMQNNSQTMNKTMFLQETTRAQKIKCATHPTMKSESIRKKIP